MTCEEAMKLFFAYLDKALKGQQLETLEDHLQECLDCCEHLDFTRQVNRVVGDRLQQQPVPGDLAKRLEAVLLEAKRKG